MRRIREVLRLKQLQRSHREISAATGLSKGSVSEYLRRAAQAGLTSEKDHPPLLAAAHNGYAEVVRLLLAAGADPEPADGRHGDTALMRASNGGHDEVVVMLLDAGANIHATDPKGLTALHFAARNAVESGNAVASVASCDECTPDDELATSRERRPSGSSRSPRKDACNSHSFPVVV